MTTDALAGEKPPYPRKTAERLEPFWLLGNPTGSREGHSPASRSPQKASRIPWSGASHGSYAAGGARLSERNTASTKPEKKHQTNFNFSPIILS